MNTCATCKHWGAKKGQYDEDDPYYLPAHALLLNMSEVAAYHGMDEKALRDRVKICGAPRLHFYVAPGPGEAAVIDGSQYTGALCTDKDFGCTLHEPNTPTGG